MLIISSDSNTLTVLNATAARLWEHLAEAHTEADLSAKVVAEFAVDASVAASDVATFLGQLEARRLVTREER